LALNTHLQPLVIEERKTMDMLGIDLAKLTFDATLLLATGIQHDASFPNTPEGFTQLQAWLGAHNITTLHGLYGSHQHLLGSAGHLVARPKTDKFDSAVIASFCTKHHPRPWEPQSEEQRRLRALVRHRDDLLQTQLQQENRLRDATDELVRSSLMLGAYLGIQPRYVLPPLKRGARWKTAHGLIAKPIPFCRTTLTSMADACIMSMRGGGHQSSWCMAIQPGPFCIGI
jgi:hypothetical protein